jgi:N-acetylglucosamine kinase-like BadF-type ATPase
MKYIIGTDGGGTKTAFAAADLSGKIIAESFSGGMNYNYIGIKEAAANYLDGVKKLNLPPDAEIAAAAIGDPSTDDASPVAGTAEFVKELKNSDILKNTEIYIKSDAYMALFGLTGGNAGVLTISGTGAMSAAFDRDGRFYVAGGWGRLTEDEGSGYYIAVNGIKAALRCHDGIGKQTALLQALLGHFKASNPRELIGVFYGPHEPAVAAFAEQVARCAEAGDGEARRILDEAADYLASYTISLIKLAGEGEMPVGIYGSVLTGNMHIRNRFTEKVKRTYPDAKITVPALKPEHAALEYAKKSVLSVEG